MCLPKGLREDWRRGCGKVNAAVGGDAQSHASTECNDDAIERLGQAPRWGCSTIGAVATNNPFDVEGFAPEDDPEEAQVAAQLHDGPKQVPKQSINSTTTKHRQTHLPTSHDNHNHNDTTALTTIRQHNDADGL